MKYRFEESLTWIIPGFYIMLYTFILVCLLFSSAIKFPEDTGTIGVYISVLVFTIPIMSLIIGWMIDAYAGYLFRIAFKWPMVSGYKEVFDENATTSKAEEEFDKALKRIDLKNVDRFYYRYVFSRNMFTMQLILVVITAILLCFSNIECGCTSLWYMLVAIVLLLSFIPIVDRDLTTHVKYVFLEDQKVNNPRYEDGQNATPTAANPD